ncbi:hypothetical protein HSBAA_PA_0820 (plasmid) [Vreelandella sulfidaeris]|uniref:Uncharacterized protein n=1 Tax=Vreelandella sulfidaeris TaxID=115553 RepID=A0A455UMH6_9GAMM|nr:hypothetical protein HSBAA_PA_0820 [Halomonas sulfidaeris]
MAKIKHDAEAFHAEIAMRVYDESVTDAIDVITRDGEPETLLAVVRSLVDFNVYYSNQKTIRRTNTPMLLSVLQLIRRTQSISH